MINPGILVLYYVNLKRRMWSIFAFHCLNFVVHCLVDEPPVPLTPDYGGPVVSYADGILDTRFNRFLSVREGKKSTISLSSRLMLACSHSIVKSFIYMIKKCLIMLLDRRESSLNPPTTIVSIALGTKDVQGKSFHLTGVFNLWRGWMNISDEYFIVASPRFSKVCYF